MITYKPKNQKAKAGKPQNRKAKKGKAQNHKTKKEVAGDISCHLSLMIETGVDSYLIILNSTLLFFA
jgi:hypothetical protein